jgi:hypothetical protein
MHTDEDLNLQGGKGCIVNYVFYYTSSCCISNICII